MIRRLWAWGIRALLLLTLALAVVDAVMLTMAMPAFGYLLVAALLWGRKRRGWQTSDAYGSARFSGLGDLIAWDLLGRRGLILGKLDFITRTSRGWALRCLVSPAVDAEWAVRQCLVAFLGSRWIGDVFIRVHTFTHLLTVAPAGGGKSVNTLVPNLRTYAGNCVVIDPKGELFNLTAAHRRKRFGHKVIRLDPAGLCGPGANRFNPFDFIDAESKQFLGLVRDMANMMVTRTGKEDDPHWNQSAENVIAALIAYVCACEGDRECRNLQGMRVFLASRDNFEAACRMMEDHDGFSGVLSQLGRSLSWHVDRELGSVMSNAQRHTNIFDDPMIADSTRVTDWNPSELRSGKMTVYLIVPADRLVVWAGLQRLWLGTLMRLVTRGVPTEKNPVLFLIDECAHIGKMQALEDAITLLRGAGIRVWLFFQSLGQLDACFGDHAPTVLDNLGTQQYFAINSYETAEALSKRMGEQTQMIRTAGGNDGTSSPVGPSMHNPRSRSRGTSYTISEISRRLLKPEEVMTLPDTASLVFHKHLPVILARRIKYHEDKAFRRGGTGKTRGIGLGGMLAACLALFTACICSLPLLAPASAPQTSFVPQAPFVPQTAIGPATVDTTPQRPVTVIEGEPPPLLSPASNPWTVPPSRPVVHPFAPPGYRRRPSPYGGLNHGQAR